MAKVSLRAYNREIEAMIDRGHLDEAIAHCQHILKTFPKHLETYRLLGKAYLEARRHEEAADIFSRVLVSEPSDFVAQVGMGIIRDEQNKLDEAIWHMERAFESQPSNAAIQSELQRLYGRRDGVQPPRIRMTRGALANMYMQGELFPQAISESRGVLKEDPARTDMQNLLAKAYYRSGQKNDAADAASAVLKRYPYCLDANRVLADILSADNAASAPTYRKRVIELDPYAAHINGSLFLSQEASDAAVVIEQLSWSGQTSKSSGWDPKQALGLDTEAPLPSSTTFAPSTGAFSSSDEPSSSGSQKEDIPEFLRAAGWGASTGAFDESKSSILDEPSAGSSGMAAEGELPEWVKAMAPKEESASGQDEELPDWIDKIGTGELPVPSAKDTDSDGQPDWLRSLGDESSSAEQPRTNESQPDWMQFGESESEVTRSSTSTDKESDWLSQLGESKEQEDESNFDFMNQPVGDMKDPADQTSKPGISQDEQDASMAWLEGLAAKQGATEGLLVDPKDRLEDEPEWIKQAKGATGKTTPEEPVSESSSAAPSQDDQDASLAWLEGLAAKQGATEGLLFKPEDRREEEPEWVKQAKKQAEQPPVEKTGEPASDETDWMEHARSVGEQFFDESMGGQKEEEAQEHPAPVDDLTQWLSGLDEQDKGEPVINETGSNEMVEVNSTASFEESSEDELPAWMQESSDEEMTFETESAPAAQEAAASSDEIPDWLSGLEDDDKPKTPAPKGELPAWMRDETGEVVAEPTKIEPTRSSDWAPMTENQKEEAAPAPSKPKPASEPKPAAQPKSQPPARKPAPAPAQKEPVTRKGTGTLSMPVDPILGSARSELSRSNIPGALETYEKLIKKGRFLEDVIYDLREALYRYPVEVSIWQTLGDAYMRANQLQDALDAYTKAEELLR